MQNIVKHSGNVLHEEQRPDPKISDISVRCRHDLPILDYPGPVQKLYPRQAPGLAGSTETVTSLTRAQRLSARSRGCPAARRVFSDVFRRTVAPRCPPRPPLWTLRRPSQSRSRSIPHVKLVSAHFSLSRRIWSGGRVVRVRRLLCGTRALSEVFASKQRSSRQPCAPSFATP